MNFLKRIPVLFILAILAYSQNSLCLNAQLIITPDLNIEDEWYKTESETVPSFSTIEKVFKNQYVSIVHVFYDYKLDSNKKANITFDIQVLSPDNSICFEQKNIPALNHQIEVKNKVQMSESNIKLCFDEADKYGTYTITSKISDHISGLSSTNTKRINLSEFKQKKYFTSDDEFSNWMFKYYMNPSPEKAVDALIYYSNSKLNENEDGFMPTISFFLSVFNNNHYLIPIIKDEYFKHDLKTKIYIIWLLKYLDYDSEKFLTSLTGDEKKVFEELKNNRIPLNTDFVNSGTHLDIQWATFSATGRFEPIKKIIDSLEFSKYSGAVDAYKNSDKTEKDREEALLDATFQAARWSLTSNIEQHDLVKKYCIYSFINDKHSDDVRLWLGVILSKAVPERFKMVKGEKGEVRFHY
ncbi:MAG: hypothetical protein JW927_12465 [Deltaproteobacteria bacterium]|nr:hypothetical protein [Deltaproteobacteria bacterium]